MMHRLDRSKYKYNGASAFHQVLSGFGCFRAKTSRMLGNLTELLLLLVSIPSDLGGGRVKKYRTSPILGLVLREEEHAPEALVLVLLFELDIAKARAIGEEL